jgi:hypothetical protein
VAGFRLDPGGAEMSEIQIVQPLSAEEIKDGIITKVCEALYDAMNSNCDLYGVAYSKFKASGQIELTLDNFGDQRLAVARIDIPFTPPNVFRKQTGQGIPVVVSDESSIEHKAVFYKRERTPRGIGRAGSDAD